MGDPGRVPDVLTVAETAERLGVSDDHVYALIAAGDLKAIKLGRLHRVPRWAVDEMIGAPTPAPSDQSAPVAETVCEAIAAVVDVLDRRVPGFDRHRLAVLLTETSGAGRSPN
jgi:excisionase family DNA binding protein